MIQSGAKAWSRRFTVASAVFFVGWQLAVLVGADRQVPIQLAVLGFVSHMIFGKAYLLIPSYFQRALPRTRVPGVQLALSAGGTALLVLSTLGGEHRSLVAAVGAVAWCLGVAVFLGTLLSLIVTRRGFGTCAPNLGSPAERFALSFVPVAFAYLLVGSYGILARTAGLPVLFDGYPPRTTHLLAAGGAGLLIFALGTQLLSRFMGVTPSKPVVGIVLPAGAVGPLALAMSLGEPSLLPFAGVVETIAIVGFTALAVRGFVQSERRRVGLYGVIAGLVSAVAAAVLGLTVATGGWTAATAVVHRRLMLVGFLGLTVVGFAYLFYPPAAGTFRGASDETALLTIGLLGTGLAVESLGHLGGSPLVATSGTIVVLFGAVGYAAFITLLLRGFRAR